MMPDEDYSTWDSIDEIGSKIYNLLQDSISGELVSL
jgi:hypothetical protein